MFQPYLTAGGEITYGSYKKLRKQKSPLKKKKSVQYTFKDTYTLKQLIFYNNHIVSWDLVL